jgi:hypothetical protein
MRPGATGRGHHSGQVQDVADHRQVPRAEILGDAAGAVVHDHAPDAGAMEDVEHALAGMCARARALGAVLGVETVHPDIEVIRAAIGAAVRQTAEAE